MANKFIEGLYEAAAGLPDKNGIPKLDEQKLKRILEKNQLLGTRNRDRFEATEEKFHSCPRYDPCPICDKCRNKASHLYVARQTCTIPICSHTYADRDKMIKRKNFERIVSPEIMNAIRETDNEVTGGINHE